MNISDFGKLKAEVDREQLRLLCAAVAAIPNSSAPPANPTTLVEVLNCLPEVSFHVHEALATPRPTWLTAEQQAALAFALLREEVWYNCRYDNDGPLVLRSAIGVAIEWQRLSNEARLAENLVEVARTLEALLPCSDAAIYAALLEIEAQGKEVGRAYALAITLVLEDEFRGRPLVWEIAEGILALT